LAYILKNDAGEIIATSLEPTGHDHWEHIDEKNEAYAAFLEAELIKHSPFRESDIHLARVLEDLIDLLISRNVIRFTDFPAAAQKRLTEREAMRNKDKSLSFDDIS